MFDLSIEQWLFIAFIAYAAFTIGRMSKSGESAEARQMRLMEEETKAANAFSSLTPSIQTDVDRLLMDKKKIEAIKLIREHTGLGLKEAKLAADRRQSEIVG